MQSYWSSQYPKLDTQVGCDNTVNLFENKTSPNNGALYPELKSDGFRNQDYVTNGPTHKTLPFNIEPAFVSAYEDSKTILAQSFDKVTNEDPLIIKDDDKKQESELPVQPNCFILCDMCGELYPPSEQGHCKPLPKSEFEANVSSHKYLEKPLPQLKNEPADVAEPSQTLCPYCNLVYETEEFAEHVKLHTSLPFICDKCGIFYSSQDEFVEHEERHGDTVLCRDCFKVCDDSIDLIMHTRIRPVPLACHKCEETFVSHCAMHSHRAICSPKKKLNMKPIYLGNYNCSECSMVFTTQQRLDEHFRQHTGERPFLCEYCGQTYSRKDNLNRHMRKNRSSRADLKFVCTACHDDYPSRCSLKKHCLEEHPDRPLELCMELPYDAGTGELIIINGRSRRTRPFENDTAVDFMSPSLPKIAKVNTPERPREKPLACSECPKSFSHPKSLSKHIRNMHRAKSGPYACHLCERSFSEVILLNRHLIWHKGANFKCHGCGVSYSYLKNLQRHLKKVNNHINDGAADKLKITSVGEIKLDTSINTNSTVNGEINNSISTNFLTYQQLLKYVDETEKPFVCQVCGKEFPSRRNYLEHYLSHSKERPFKCDICSQGFIRERKMLDHKLEHQRRIKYQSKEPKEYQRRVNQELNDCESPRKSLRPRPEVSPYVTQFQDVEFKTPSIKLSRLDDEDVEMSDDSMDFRCNRCDRVFNRKVALISHQKACSVVSFMTDDEVPRARRSKPFKYLHSFEKNDRLVVYGMEHLVSVVNGEQHFTCGVCGRTFNKKNFIFKHTLIHVTDKPFKCALCISRGFMTRNSLKKHFRKCHKGLVIDRDGNVASKDGTTVAPLSTWNKPASEAHVEISLLANRLTQGYTENYSSEAPEQIMVEWDLDDIMNMFEPEVILEKEEVAEIEETEFIPAVSLISQPDLPISATLFGQLGHVKEEQSDLQMQYDAYADYQLDDLTMNHFLEANEEEPNEDAHYSRQAGSNMITEENFLTCGQCNTTLETKDELFKHYIVHDMAHDPIKCAICDKEFIRRQYLQMHAMMHARIKTYHCEYCEKAFRTKRDMDDHVRTHTGEKPFACEQCDRRFRVRKQLYAHRKSHVQPFQCRKCSCGFSLEWSLKRHEKVCLQQNQNAVPSNDVEISGKVLGKESVNRGGASDLLSSNDAIKAESNNVSEIKETDKC